MSVTVGQLIKAADLLSIDLAEEGVPDLSNLSQDAVVGEDILTIVAIFWPPAALIEDALEIAVILAPLILASGISIKPDLDPIHDAQTTETPHAGRNG